MRIVRQRFSGLFEDRYGHFPCHGGELIEKDVEAFTFLQIVEQVLDGYARPCEHRFSALNSRIDNDY